MREKKRESTRGKRTLQGLRESDREKESARAKYRVRERERERVRGDSVKERESKGRTSKTGVRESRRNR